MIDLCVCRDDEALTPPPDTPTRDSPPGDTHSTGYVTLLIPASNLCSCMLQE